jgi:hypothetical protein
MFFYVWPVFGKSDVRLYCDEESIVAWFIILTKLTLRQVSGFLSERYQIWISTELMAILNIFNVFLVILM